MITGYIRGQDLELRSPMIAADTIDYLTAQFVFQTKDWDGCRKFSHWTCGASEYSIELENDRISEAAHLNLTAGTWTVWIHGERYADGKLIQRITTDEAILQVKATGTGGGDPFPESPASEIEQIHAELDDLKKVSDEAIAEAVDRYFDENPINIPPVGRAVVVLAGTDFDNITVYGVVAPDQESDPVELLRAREADVILVLERENGGVIAPLVLSEFDPEQFTGEAYGNVVTEDGAYNVVAQFGFEGGRAYITVLSAFEGGSSGTGEYRWVEILPETEGAHNDDPNSMGMELTGAMDVSPGDKCRVSYWSYNNNKGEIDVTVEVTAEAIDFYGTPAIVLSDYIGDKYDPEGMQTFAIFYFPSFGGSLVEDVNHASRCRVRVEKLVDGGVSRSEFDALAETVNKRIDEVSEAKVGKDQGKENAGKLLYVGADGVVTMLTLGSGLEIKNGVLMLTNAAVIEAICGRAICGEIICGGV